MVSVRGSMNASAGVWQRRPRSYVSVDSRRSPISSRPRHCFDGSGRWGYTRIRDALDNLGHEISRDTVANILKDHGIEPAPERGPHTTWADFLRRHWEVMAATDFFTVEIWSVKGIVRYQVLFVIRLATREVHIAGITAEGHGSWMEQIARNLLPAEPQQSSL